MKMNFEINDHKGKYESKHAKRQPRDTNFDQNKLLQKYQLSYQARFVKDEPNDPKIYRSKQTPIDLETKLKDSVLSKYQKVPEKQNTKKRVSKYQKKTIPTEGKNKLQSILQKYDTKKVQPKPSNPHLNHLKLNYYDTSIQHDKQQPHSYKTTQQFYHRERPSDQIRMPPLPFTPNPNPTKAHDDSIPAHHYSKAPMKTTNSEILKSKIQQASRSLDQENVKENTERRVSRISSEKEERKRQILQRISQLNKRINRQTVHKAARQQGLTQTPQQKRLLLLLHQKDQQISHLQQDRTILHKQLLQIQEENHHLKAAVEQFQLLFNQLQGM